MMKSGVKQLWSQWSTADMCALPRAPTHTHASSINSNKAANKLCSHVCKHSRSVHTSSHAHTGAHTNSHTLWRTARSAQHHPGQHNTHTYQGPTIIRGTGSQTRLLPGHKTGVVFSAATKPPAHHS